RIGGQVEVFGVEQVAILPHHDAVVSARGQTHEVAARGSVAVEGSDTLASLVVNEPWRPEAEATKNTSSSGVLMGQPKFSGSLHLPLWYTDLKIS
nr:hypothetical protein [Tanacetum cinerariifolium]